MKALFIQHSGWITGSAISMVQLVQALDLKGFKSKVVFSADGPMVKVANEMGLDARVVNMKSVFFYGSHVPFTIRNFLPFIVDYRRTVAAIEDIVTQERPDLVHLNTSVLVPAATQIKKMNVPIVWHVREGVGPNHMLRNWQINRIESLATHIVANSHYVARDYSGATPVSVIHNAIDKNFFSPMSEDARIQTRADLGLAKDEPVVGMIGAVSAVKGHYFLVDAATQVAKAIPNVRFLIVAGGVGDAYSRSLKGRIKRLGRMPLDNLERMKKLIQERGLTEHFVFSGFRRDIPQMISAMDVLAFPSLLPEGFGRPLIEAMAMACPMVSTDIGPTREVVGEGTAELVHPGDVEGLGAALIKLLTDCSLAEEMGRAGRARFLENFEMENMVSRVIDVYSKVVPVSEFRERDR